jgi:hypothetical protein
MIVPKAMIQARRFKPKNPRGLFAGGDLFRDPVQLLRIS